MPYDLTGTATYDTGYSGQGFVGNGADGILIADDLLFSSATVSVSVRFKLTGSGIKVACGVSGLWVLGYNNGDTYAQYNGSGGGSTVTLSKSLTVNDDAWHLVVFAFGPGGGSLQVDGTTAVTSGTAYIPADGGGFFVGGVEGLVSDATYTWPGGLDELSVSLDGVEVALYHFEDDGINSVGSVDATAYTFSGPDAGPLNEASANFTVQPNGSYTGTITPHTDGSGTFTPSSLSWTAGLTAKAFTYTPTTAAGSPHTISVTSSPGLTDPASLEYAILYERVDVTIDGVQAMILLPTNYDAGAGANLIIYHHGAGGSRESLINNYQQQNLPLTLALLAQGYVLCGSDAHGNAWGNQDAVDDMTGLRDYVAAHYTVNQTGFWCESMGGLTAKLCLASGDFPEVSALYELFAVADLASMFAENAGAYASDIRAAYGIASDGSDYAALTAGHDPILIDAASYAGIRHYRALHSADDTAVEKSANTDAFAALIDAYAEENVVFHTTGNHGDVVNYQAQDIGWFFENAFAPGGGSGGGGAGINGSAILGML